ncbi:6854_t:CDS:10 [Acaulospora morrowiae]|uniref:Nicastrin n=1 Tax=Acaulospora morrowiae TaxID=94023 RepID=A0A9N8Z0W8_9GLOM|nr:6854_t:CDS:10 [Acaulospora morrowiae]
MRPSRHLFFGLVISFIQCLLFPPVISQTSDGNDPLYDAFYQDLGGAACVRLLNSTGVIGCQALKPTTGVLYLTDTQDSLTQFIKNGPSGAFAVILPYQLMTNENLRALGSSGKLGGVIAVINGTSNLIASRPNSFSPDELCPNCQFGLYRNDSNQYNWNPNGIGLIQQSFEFPIFALYPIDDGSSNAYNMIMDGAAYNAANSFKSYPLKAVEFNSMMWAAIDAKTCLRRNFCSPIGGYSVYSTPSLNMTNDDGKPIVIVAAAMDSRALFHDLILGVDNGISGTIAVLAVADALSRSPVPVTTFSKHILYTLFTGEAWGFAGSQRFVNDITTPFVCKSNQTHATENCPFVGVCSSPCIHDKDFEQINFAKIDSIFEFSQVGINTTGFYAHVDDPKNSKNNLLITQLERLSAAANNGSSFVKPAYNGVTNRKLPPSSSMAFLEKNRKLSALVLGDFQADLKKYYNSEYDDGFDMSSVGASICSIANVTAQAVWLQAQGITNATTVPISVNCDLIQQLLYCLVYNYSCPIVESLYNTSDSGRISHYSGVFQINFPSDISFFVFNYLSNLTASNTSSKANCQDDDDCKSGEFCVASKCTKSFTRYHSSYGAGFEYDQNGNPLIADATKATWVESVWNTINMRIFIVSSISQQLVELFSGIIITIISILCVIFGKKYLKKTLKVA